jgi:hypothetical protein
MAAATRKPTSSSAPTELIRSKDLKSHFLISIEQYFFPFQRNMVILKKCIRFVSLLCSSKQAWLNIAKY